jgi:hypothetical protein
MYPCVQVAGNAVDLSIGADQVSDMCVCMYVVCVCVHVSDTQDTSQATETKGMVPSLLSTAVRLHRQISESSGGTMWDR